MRHLVGGIEVIDLEVGRAATFDARLSGEPFSAAASRPDALVCALALGVLVGHGRLLSANCASATRSVTGGVSPIMGRMSDRKPLAAIIRSSDRVAERKREGTFHGDEDQLGEVKRYCKAKGLTFELLEPELDVSGGKPIDARPALLEAIEGVEAGVYSGIVTANLKRLTRSRSGLEIWTRVEAAGGHVHTAAENVDTSTPNGRFMRDIFLADAVREREEHADRHAKRRAATVNAGMWRQRQLPRGYVFKGPPDAGGRVRGQARKLVPGPGAHQVVAAFHDRARGVPVVTIADRLGMTPGGVRAMLRNRVYLGELHDGENVNTEAHDALITVEEFQAAQGQPRPPRSRSGGVALLAGLVRCQACGHIMSRSGGQARTYNCFGRSSAGRCPAPAAISARPAEEHVAAIARSELDRIALTASDANTGADKAREQLRAAEAELAGYLQAVSVADVGGEAFAIGARTRRVAVDQARNELRRRIALRPLPPGFNSGAEVWDQLNDHGRNQLLRALLEVVIVRRAGGRGARVPVTERVRVVAHGAGVELVERRAGRAAGIRPLLFPDLSDEHVLRIPVGEEPL